MLLGVDGGGTSTEAWLAEASGQVLGRGVSGPSNAKAVGLEAARRRSTRRSAPRSTPPVSSRPRSTSPAWDWRASTGPMIARSSPAGPTRLAWRDD